MIRVAPLCLDGAARDYYYSTGRAAGTLDEFFEVMQLRYGLTQSAALDHFFQLHQLPNQTVKQFADAL